MRSDLDVMLDGARSGRLMDSKWARLMICQHAGVEQEVVAEKIAQAIVDGFEPGRMTTENLDAVGVDYQFYCSFLHGSIQLAVLKKIAPANTGRGRLIFDEIISTENNQDQINEEFIEAAIPHCLAFDNPHRQTLAEDICKGLLYKAVSLGQDIPEKVFLLINTEDVEDVASLLILAGDAYMKHKYQAGAKTPKEEPKTEYDEMVGWLDVISSKGPAKKQKSLDRALTLVLQDRKWPSPMNINLLLSAGADWANVQKENIHPLREDLEKLIGSHPAVRRTLLMGVARQNTAADSERIHEAKRPGI